MRCLVAGAGSAPGRLPAGAAADVEVEFIDADGTPRREPLSDCWNVAFERVAAVRGFASFRGQRNRPGLWWFATTCGATRGCHWKRHEMSADGATKMSVLGTG